MLWQQAFNWNWHFKNWKSIGEICKKFVLWKYSHQHMNISDADSVHCSTYGLGGTCDHEHVGACEHFTRFPYFLYTTFASFLNEIVLKKLNNDQLWLEINTMINVMSCFTLMAKHYTGQRVQSMVQLDIIYKIKNEWMKGYKSKNIIMLDHKKKVLGMKFHGGKVDLFWRNGMIILGSMEVKWKECNDRLQSQLFSYFFLAVL